jgi:transposase InsO family protein
VVCKEGTPALLAAKQTSKLARRVAAELREAGWRAERFLSDNGNEFKGEFTKTASRLKAKPTRIRAGRPQANGNVEALHRTILDECWRPSFARYLHPLSRASVVRSDEPWVSAHLGVRAGMTIPGRSRQC